MMVPKSSLFPATLVRSAGPVVGTPSRRASPLALEQPQLI